jgi:hypothetical protein
MAKRFDAKAKAKRQKIMAAGGAVLLLGVLAIQVPRTMKMLNREAPPPPAAAAPTTVAGDPSVLPTPGTVGGGAAPTASGGGTLVDSDATPAPSAGQLIAFGRFASKDPFRQQIDERAIPASPSTDSESEPKPNAGSADPSSGEPGAEPSPDAPAGAAVIAVNGTEETVAVGAAFPKDSPVFKLVKLTGGQAKVAIAGGSFASGAATVTLERGKTLTLVNTADGTRYELKLVSIG